MSRRTLKLPSSGPDHNKNIFAMLFIQDFIMRVKARMWDTPLPACLFPSSFSL